MKISQTSEDKLIHELTKDLETRSAVLVGVGDDCAVLRKNEHQHTLLKTDTVVEHVHFLSEEKPTRVGWKAAARVVSDFAAMGGYPEALMISIILPPETAQVWVEQLYQGIQSVTEKFHCSIVGGETSSAPPNSPIVVSISGSGIVKPENLTLRSGGKPSDLIYVTGTLGGSIHGKHLDFIPRLEEAIWLAENAQATSMMDLSDGIAKDLPRLAKCSKCGYEIDLKSLPLSLNSTIKNALNDGEDYELLFTIPEYQKQILESTWTETFPDLSITHIGELTEHEEDTLEGGWDHFGQEFKSP